MASFGNVLDAFVRFLSDTKDIDRALDKEIPGKAQAAGQKAGTAMSGMFKTVAGGIGGAVFASAIEGATKFEDQLATINTVAKLPEETLKGIGDQILDLSRETGKSTDDLTTGFYDLVSAGVPAEEAISVLKNSAILATGALGTTAETVDLVTSALGAYGLEAKDSKRVTDIFAQAVADGKTTAADLAAGISTIAPIAASAGVSLEEVGASAAIMTLRGDSASQAFTKMKAAVSAFLTPNETLNKIQQQTGKNFLEMLKQGVPLQTVLEELRLATQGNDEAFAKALGSTDALSFALSVTGENSAAAAAELDKVRAGADEGTVAIDQYNIAQGSAAAGGRRLTAEIKAFLIEFGSPFVSTFGGAVTALGLLGPAFGSVRTGAKLAGAALGALLSRGITPLITGLKNLAAAGSLGGLFQDLALGRKLGPALRDSIAALGRNRAVMAATSAAGAVLGPIFSAAMFAGQKVASVAAAALGAVLNAPIVKAAVHTAGLAVGGAYGRAIAIGTRIAIVTGVAALANEIKRPLQDLASQIHETIFADDGPLGGIGNFFEGVGKGIKDLPWPLGTKGQPDWASFNGQAEDAGEDMATSFREGFANGQVSAGVAEGAGSVPAAIRDSQHDVKAAAEDVGAEIETGIGGGAEGALRTVNQSNSGILTSIKALRDSIVGGATEVANALYDPILKAAELAETQAELRANKQKLISQDLTAAERKELLIRNDQLRKQLIIQNADLLTYGTQAEQISKTKAFLASNFWVQAYEDATPEQAAALDAWRAELTTHLEDMERDAAQGGEDVRDGYTQPIKDGKDDVNRATKTMVSGMDGPMDRAKDDAYRDGQRVTRNFASGLTSEQSKVEHAASRLAGALGNFLKVSSPAKMGPLSEAGGPEGWMRRMVSLMAGEIAGGVGDLASAARTAAGGIASGFEGAGALPVVNPALGTLAGLSGTFPPSSLPPTNGGGNTYEYHIHAEGPLRIKDPFDAANTLSRFQQSGLLPEPGADDV